MLMAKKKYTQETFIAEARNMYGDRFDYSLVEYKTLHTSKVKIKCIEHDTVFEQIPKRHLQFMGCRLCSSCSKKTKEDFVLNAKSIHNDKYNYDEFEYINNKTKGKVICNNCSNSWFVRPDNHIGNKTGCPNCVEHSIYTEEYYINNNISNHDCYLYLVEFDNGTESFLKIGITKHDKIKYRFRGQLSEYDFNLMFFIKTDFYTAYREEQNFHLKYKAQSYTPTVKFKGWTECFNIDNKKEILQDFINLSP